MSQRSLLLFKNVWRHSKKSRWLSFAGGKKSLGKTRQVIYPSNLLAFLQSFCFTELLRYRLSIVSWANVQLTPSTIKRESCLVGTKRMLYLSSEGSNNNSCSLSILSPCFFWPMKNGGLQNASQELRVFHPIMHRLSQKKGTHKRREHTRKVGGDASYRVDFQTYQKRYMQKTARKIQKFKTKIVGIKPMSAQQNNLIWWRMRENEEQSRRLLRSQWAQRLGFCWERSKKKKKKKNSQLLQLLAAAFIGRASPGKLPLSSPSSHGRPSPKLG